MENGILNSILTQKMNFCPFAVLDIMKLNREDETVEKVSESAESFYSHSFVTRINFFSEV